MSEHTKEPWCVSTESPRIIKADYSSIGSDAGPLIGSTCGHPSSGFFPTEDEGRANARRIVACVNACAGIDTAFLEGKKFTDCSTTRAAIAQRDELLEVLKRAKVLFDRALPKFNWVAACLDAEDISMLNEVPWEVRAAIAKVEKVK